MSEIGDSPGSVEVECVYKTKGDPTSNRSLEWGFGAGV